MRRYDLFTGCIAAGSFTSGETVVVGAWRSSPIGQLVDVMWVRPDGQRILLAPDERARAYVAAVYRFDRTEVVEVVGGWDGGAVSVEAGPVRVRLVGGDRDWRSWVFASRPRILRRSPAWISVEDLLGRPVVGALIGGARGVRAAGVAPGGQQERYGVDDWRPVVHGSLEIAGEDAGALCSLPPDLGIGLSGFPRRPAIVHVGTMIERTASG
jgi:hypothetical protein